MRIQVFADPGHSWARVKRIWLHKLEIASTISSCSYERGDWVYLEEDDDLHKFIRAYVNAPFDQKGKALIFERSHTNRQSKIRNYLPYVYRGEL